MASLRKKTTSPFFFACYNLPNGKRVQKSTKSDNREIAELIAEEWETEAKKKRTVQNALQGLSKIRTIVHGTGISLPSFSEFGAQWLKQKLPEVAKSTHEAYRQTIAQLEEHLGAKSAESIDQVSRDDILAWRLKLAGEKNPSTVNNQLKILRIFFKSAKRDQILQENPAEDIASLKNRPGREERRPFTMEELSKVLSCATGEWRGIILTAYYTGQRLGDVVNLNWTSVDMPNREIRIKALKTGNTVHVPISDKLFSHFEEIRRANSSPKFLFPASQATYSKHRRTAILSNQFAAILAAAGLRATARHRKKLQSVKPSATGGRDGHELSFHSLRHTTTTFLKQFGSSEAVAADIIGHESPAISQSYTQIDTKTKREALQRLPDLN